jgi:hypothetical protein
MLGLSMLTNQVGIIKNLRPFQISQT